MDSGRSVAVIGAGSHGRCVVAALRAAGREPTVVFDDSESLWGTDCLGVGVAGPIESARRHAGPAVIAIGSNAARARIAGALDLDWVTVVHPFAWVDPTAELGAGTVVMAGGVIHTGARIGVHAIISIRASISHDAVVGDFSLISPASHIGAHATLGTGVFMGAASAANNEVTIGDWSVVGMGAIALCDVPGLVIVAGVPARILRHLDAPYDGTKYAVTDTVNPAARVVGDRAKGQADG